MLGTALSRPAARADVDRNGLFSGSPLTGRDRLFTAALVGLGVGAMAWIAMNMGPQYAARDFTYPWRAARALLAGHNPYEVIVPAQHYPYESRFPYPLPAAVAVLPFAGLAAVPAAALFTGLSSGLLAWATAGEGTWRFWTFLSAPLWLVLQLGQWSPLLMAGALIPTLGFALALKPTLGLALFAWRPSWRAAIAGLLLCAACFLLVPTWPLDWVRAARETTGHSPPVLQPWGWLPLVALVRWRRPEARLVAVLACVPQNPYFYDQLPLWLVAWNGPTAFLLTALSWVAYAGARLQCTNSHYCGAEAMPWVRGLLYAPAAALVLLRGRALPSPWCRWMGERRSA
jgi:hypothetical protein